MRFRNWVGYGALALASCSPDGQIAGKQLDGVRAGSRATDGWRLHSTGTGTGLALSSGGAVAMTLVCSKEPGRLEVNVRAFRPIGSEERFSFGGGGHVMALVADLAADGQRSGVTGVGKIPDELKSFLVGKTVSASYGAQTSGPHPAPPYELARDFLGICSSFSTAERLAATRPTASTHPCEVQDGRVINISPIRAVGTEPFWGARIQGRCVTYSTPDDQAGTRIWTRIDNGPDGGIWAGTYKGKLFRLIPIPVPACSDGMSDEVYSMKVDLLVEGEQRRGCAEPMLKSDAGKP